MVTDAVLEQVYSDQPAGCVAISRRERRKMGSVDVVVPCYNYGRYLRQCVASVLSAGDLEARVLIIDDCSLTN